MAYEFDHDDVLDIRDIIERVEELEDNPLSAEEREELKALRELLVDLKGCGGDEKWRGDWYPLTLIRDSYFRAYAQELAEDCGMIQSGLAWPYTCIDWDQAARELRMDYSAVEVDGVTYWYQ